MIKIQNLKDLNTIMCSWFWICP